MYRFHPKAVWAANAVLLLAGATTAAAQQFTVDPLNLTFSNVPSGAISPAQAITIETQVPTTVVVQVTSGETWVDVDPLGPVNVSGTTAINVRADARELATGSYDGTIRVSTQSLQILVPVHVTVSGTTVLSANVNNLNFTAQEGGSPNPASAAVLVFSSAGQLSYTLSASTEGGTNWLILSATQGSTGSGFSVSVNPAGLAPGTYEGTVLVESVTTSDALQIPVTLVISSGATLSVTPATPSTFLYQLGGVAPASQNLTVSSSGGTVAFTVAESPPTTWLVVSPLSGSAGATPATITLGINTTGLTAGTYSANVIVTPDGGTPLPPIPVKLVVSSHPLLQLSTNSLGFTAPFGGAAPPSQTFSVSASGVGNPVPFSVTSSAAWITVSPATGTTASSITVSADPSNLAVGNYPSTLTVRPTNGDQYILTVNVLFTITEVAEITAGPGALLFSHQTNQLPPQAQTVALRSSGQPIQFSVDTMTSSCGGAWLNASSSQLVTPAVISVSIIAGGLAPGMCSGTVRVSYLSGPSVRTVSIPVTVAVSNTPELRVSLEQGFGDVTVRQGSSGSPMRVTVTSTDSIMQVDYSMTATSTGGPWLLVPAPGTTPQSVSVLVLPAGLQPGVYTGEVRISSSTLPSAFVVPVTLRVLPDITVTVAPTSLTFSQPQGGTPSPPQNLTVTSSQPGASFTASIVQVTGGDWLAIDRSSGSAMGSVAVSVKPNSLPRNTYTSRIVFAFQNAATDPVTVPVTLTVSAPKTLTVSKSSLSFAYEMGGEAPVSQTFSVDATPGPANFTVGTVSTGGWLSAAPDSGTTPQDVTVSVDPAGLAVGTYNGSVTVTAPGAVGSPRTVDVSLAITEAPPPPPPVITTVTNTASNQAGPVAGGELVTLKGTFLPEGVPDALFTVTPQNTVASTLSGIRVLFDGIPGIPIFVSRGQINVIAPYEIAGRLLVTIVVEYEGRQSLGVQIQVAAAAPGIFTLDSSGFGQAAAINQDGTFNGPLLPTGPPTASTTPAKAGQVIVVYATGGGQTNPPSITGSVSPLDRLLRVPGTVTATIGGLPATVRFIGAAPGLVSGVIQVNLLPHPNAHGNSLAVEITINGVPSPSSATVAIE